jgi:hypothetical protein
MAATVGTGCDVFGDPGPPDRRDPGLDRAVKVVLADVTRVSVALGATG